MLLDNKELDNKKGEAGEIHKCLKILENAYTKI
jgi:hypothetical protein